MKQNDLRLKAIISYIIESADNALEDYNKDRDNVSAGRLIGYASCLKTIQAEIDEDQLSAFGLDFDIDKKYL